MTGPDRLDEQALREWLAYRVAMLTGVREELLGQDRPLSELGVSSRDAVVLAGELGELVGRDLPPGLLWQHPTINLLAASLSGRADEPGESGHADPGEPVAVIGIGCRLPGGVDSPEAFWRLLESGVDAVGPVPDDRWQRFARPDSYAGLPDHGGFLRDVAGFDATFFGISPREAMSMDPQQRILLEVTWAALEHAGMSARKLRGSRTGVFVGASSSEYGYLTMTELDAIDGWSGTGAAASILANRLSYHFDLRGPSVVVDTACSSSLVAVHQAVRSLQSRESGLAVAAGVNLLLSPAITTTFHRAGALAADARCKAFDAAADGIVRGEGCGVVLLKRLVDARRDGDRVLAVIRGTAVNSDGRSNGLTAPSPDAQRRLLAEAHAVAESDPSTVDYIEAHGTGTFLGDPIEASALAAVFGRGRSAARPLLIGSVKTNLGHLEGAAGIVGLIKTVLSLRAGRIPASLHFTEPNPQIDFAESALRVVDRETAWPHYGVTARAGVSAFGFGGTNAHVVLEEWPQATVEHSARWGSRASVFAVSGHSDTALATRAGHLAEWLDTPAGRAASPEELAAALAARDQHPNRAAVVTSDRRALVKGLRAIATRSAAPGVVTGYERPEPAGPVFVFSGYGSQWRGMGRRLLSQEPEFRAAVDRLEPVFLSIADFSLRTALRSNHRATDVGIVQPTLFGMQMALTALWRAHGVEPSAVIGHSMGEVAAAVASGALSVADGLRTVVTRSRLLAEISSAGSGAMAVVELSADELAALEERFPGVSVAVYTSPTQCTISGGTAEVGALVAHVESLGRLAKHLKVTGAGHSAAVDAVLGEFRTGLGALTVGEPTTTCYSSVLDDPRALPAFDEDYWVANLRRPVRFTQALAAAMADGHTVFVEISPHPIALMAVVQTAAGSSGVHALPSLSRDSAKREDFLSTLATLHVLGHPVALERRYPVAAVLDLPGPVWRHRSYWPSPVVRRVGSWHPLLGVHVEVPGEDRHLWQATLVPETLPWLEDHQVHGVPVLPGTAYLEMVLSGAAEALSCGLSSLVVTDLELLELLPTTGEVQLTTELRPDGMVDVKSKTDGEWTVHARAKVLLDSAPPSPLVFCGESPGGRPVDLYPELAKAGQAYGRAFQGLRSVLAASGRAAADIALPGEAAEHAAFGLHPVLADVCLHTLAAAALAAVDQTGPATYLPTAIGSVRVLGDPRSGVRCVAALEESGSEIVGAVQLLDVDNRVLVDIAGVRARRLGQSLADRLFEVRYRAAPLPESPDSPPGTWLILTDGRVHSLAQSVLLSTSLIAAGEHPYVLPDSDLDELAVVLGEMAVSGVVFLAGATLRYRSPEAAQDLVHTVAGIVRHLVGASTRPPRLYLASGGEPGCSTLRGLVRVLAFEHPELSATLVDVDEESGMDALVECLRSGLRDDEVALRKGKRLVARLARVSLPEREPAFPVRAGAYVVTGGLGSLGRVTARWLAGKGASRIVLCGRTRPPAEIEAELRTLDVEIRIVLGDIADPDVAEALVAEAADGGMPVRGVVHAAGVLEDRLTADLGRDDLAAVWRPKALGGWRLHQATEELALDWWVVFSSAAALFGSPGQVAYATANAWLDGLVQRRREQGLPATTIHWGAWADTVAVGNPLLEPISADEGVEALEAVLASGRAATAVARLDLGGALDLFPGLADIPMFDGLTAELGPVGGPAVLDLDALVHGSVPDAIIAVTDRLATAIAQFLGYPPGEIDRGLPLTRLGLDSLMAMRARAAIEREFGVLTPIPLLLRGASLAGIAAHVVAELGLGATGPRVERPPAPTLRPVAPRDATERWLAGLWRDVLPGREFGVDEDFFASGGDQALAERVSDRVSARLGPTPALFTEPTISAMADLVRSRFEGTGQGPARVLCASGDRPPLFLFHPAGGPTSVYRPLIDLLGGRQPCHGFERLDELDTVEDKAARYVELLLAIQPDGPYRLGGWSFGGMLAYEVAGRLTRLGMRVDLVALIDTIRPLPVAEGTEDDAIVARLGRFADHVSEVYGTELSLPAEEVRGIGDDQQLLLVMTRLAEAVPGMGEAVLRHQMTSYADARVAERYRPARYDGRVVLYRAEDPHPVTTTLDPRYLRTDAALGWDAVCGDLEVVTVPGDHLSMIDPPHVAVLARHLDVALAEAEPPERGRDVRQPSYEAGVDHS